MEKGLDMQLGLGRTIFPGWSAAAMLVKEHGVDAASWARDAANTSDPKARLELSMRALTSFDHAIDNVNRLPVGWVVKGAGLYYRGYDLAKKVVTMIIASGAVKGARQLVGRQSILAAKDEFLEGVSASRADRSRYGMRFASGWMSGASEDTWSGAMMLHDRELGQPLKRGFEDIRRAVARRRDIDDTRVRAVTELYDRAAEQLRRDAELAPGASTVPDAAALARLDSATRQALLVVEEYGRALAAAVPDERAIDRLAEAEASRRAVDLEQLDVAG